MYSTQRNKFMWLCGMVVAEETKCNDHVSLCKCTVYAGVNILTPTLPLNPYIVITLTQISFLLLPFDKS